MRAWAQGGVMFSHILAPLDGSPLAACVLPHVVSVARATGAQVTLLRVLERGGHGLAGDVNPFDWQMQKLEAQAYLDEIAEQLLHTVDLPVTTDLLEGSAAVQIVDHAQRIDADLVVLSSHGQGGLSDWHTSSIAQKVIQRAGISVLLTRAWRPEAICEPAHWGDQRYHRILAPLDGSPRAECVLPIATALAEHATLWLVHVVTRPELFQRMPLTTEEQTLLEQIVKRNQQQATHYLEQLQTRLVPIPRTHILANHNVATMLHRFVAQEQIDLVLLCAHGFSGQAQWPFGSLAHSFIHYGETPLLIVQDMPRCSSGAIRTAVHSTVQAARTASVAALTEHQVASQYGGNSEFPAVRYPSGVDRNHAYTF
jgi:nucleotide-binding universal stress UspA family protein